MFIIFYFSVKSPTVVWYVPEFDMDSSLSSVMDKYSKTMQTMETKKDISSKYPEKKLHKK